MQGCPSAVSIVTTNQRGHTQTSWKPMSSGTTFVTWYFDAALPQRALNPSPFSLLTVGLQAPCLSHNSSNQESWGCVCIHTHPLFSYFMLWVATVQFILRISGTSKLHIGNYHKLENKVEQWQFSSFFPFTRSKCFIPALLKKLICSLYVLYI